MWPTVHHNLRYCPAHSAAIHRWFTTEIQVGTFAVQPGRKTVMLAKSARQLTGTKQKQRRLQSGTVAIRRSKFRGGAGGRNQKALARLHSGGIAQSGAARLRCRGGGSFAAPTGRALSEVVN